MEREFRFRRLSGAPFYLRPAPEALRQGAQETQALPAERKPRHVLPLSQFRSPVERLETAVEQHRLRRRSRESRALREHDFGKRRPFPHPKPVERPERRSVNDPARRQPCMDIRRRERREPLLQRLERHRGFPGAAGADLAFRVELPLRPGLPARHLEAPLRVHQHLAPSGPPRPGRAAGGAARPRASRTDHDPAPRAPRTPAPRRAPPAPPPPRTPGGPPARPGLPRRVRSRTPSRPGAGRSAPPTADVPPRERAASAAPPSSAPAGTDTWAATPGAGAPPRRAPRRRRPPRPRTPTPPQRRSRRLRLSGDSRPTRDSRRPARRAPPSDRAPRRDRSPPGVRRRVPRTSPSPP